MHTLNTTSIVPLKMESDGVIRVGQTRVTLDSVVNAFLSGSTAEEIVFQYPSLDLGDVYAVLGYYLKNQSSVDVYLEAGRLEVRSHRLKAGETFPSSGLRQRLIERIARAARNDA
jgi:uncharacterized protein (DUF433 family)